MKSTMTASTAQPASPNVVYTPAAEGSKKSNSRAMFMGLGIAIGIILLAILAMDLMAFAQGGAEQDFGGLAVSQVAPDFTATTLAGDTFQLSDYQGQPVMLTFWSPECEACIAELPTLQAIADDANADVTMITIAVDATPAGITDLFAQKGINIPVIVDGAGDIARQYDLSYIPFSYFINPDGTVGQNMSPDKVSGDQLHMELLSWLDTCKGEIGCKVN